MATIQVIIGVLLFQLTICEDIIKINNKKFPNDFMFAVGSSAIQVEGAWNEDGKLESVWDTQVHLNTARSIDNSTHDISTDSYHRYKEDVAMLKSLGVPCYRFSISWPRVLPTGMVDNINPLGLAYYKNLIAELKANDIKPLVMIFHYDIPTALEKMGSILNSSFPDWLAAYSDLLFNELGNDVKYWFTINEPYEMCLGVEPDKAYICMMNMIKGHAKMWHIYNDRYRSKQNGKVSLILNRNWNEPETSSADDLIAAQTKMQFTYGLFAHPLYYGDWPAVVKSRVDLRSKLEGYSESRLPKFTKEEIDYIKGSIDFFSVNIYSSSIAKAASEPEIGKVTLTNDAGIYEYQQDSWLLSNSSCFKVVPWGIRHLLKWIDQEYFNPEIMITESGYCDRGGKNDVIRQQFLISHLSNVLDAMEYDFVNVIGYTYWSFLDSYEWLSGYTAKYGLVEVDFNDPNRTRTRKDSSYYYQKVCETRCLTDKCVD